MGAHFLFTRSAPRTFFKIYYAFTAIIRANIRCPKSGALKKGKLSSRALFRRNKFGACWLNENFRCFASRKGDVAARAKIVLLKNSLRCDANKRFIENSAAKFFYMRDLATHFSRFFFQRWVNSFSLEQKKNKNSFNLYSELMQPERNFVTQIWFELIFHQCFG